MRETLNIADWGTIIAYALLLVGIALYHARKVKRQDDFFLAGRSMSRWPIALSMFMALFSTNSFIGQVGWLNRPQGTLWIMVSIVGMVAAVPLAIWLFPSLFFRLRLRTAYEFLEKRFSYPVRALAAFLFLSARAMWMSTMLYAASLVISMMLGWTPERGVENGQAWAILIIGCLGILFCFSGGMRAVIWTDVVQFFVMMGGVAVMVVLAVAYTGGPSQTVDIAVNSGKFTTPALLSLNDDISLISLFLFGFFGMLFNTGADQVYLQTYFTAKSEREAKRSLWRDGVLLKPLSVIFPGLGLVLFAYYQTHPLHADFMRVPDDALPVFVLHVLPAGIRGLMVAAITSALLTSLEGGMAAMSATVQVDYIRPHLRKPLAERSAVRLGRGLVLVWGIVVITGALWVRRLGTENNIIQILNIVMYPFSGVLLGIFLLAVLARRATSAGVLIGGGVGFLIVELFPLARALPALGNVHVEILPAAASRLLATLGAVSDFYYCVIGAVATFTIGWVASLAFPAPVARQVEGLTRWRMPDPMLDQTYPQGAKEESVASDQMSNYRREHHG